MNRQRKRLLALFTVLVMLLNVSGDVFAGGGLHTTPGSINMEVDQGEPNDPGAQEVIENSGEADAQGSDDEESEGSEDENEADGTSEVDDEEVEGPEVEDETVGAPVVEEDEPVTLETEVDGVGITISAEVGVLSKDTTLSVKPIEDEDSKHYARQITKSTGDSLDKFIAFDITLLDKEGNEVQPNGEVKVSFSGIEFIRDANEIGVYHLKPDVEKEQDTNLFGSRGVALNKTNEDITINEIDAESNNDEIIFNADHFSIYGVGTISTATYKFYVPNEVEPVDTQIVLNGESLKEPAAPKKLDKKRFKGWQIVGESTLIDFNNPITVASPSSEKKVNAVYEDVIYVYFLYDDVNGDSSDPLDYSVIATKEVIAPETTVDASNIQLVVNIPGKAFSHWSTIQNGAEFVFTNNSITEDTKLYAVLADRWKVTFDAQGGSPVLPKYIVNGEEVVTITPPPTRPGYTFQRWSLVQNGATAYDFGAPVTTSFTLYAVWKAETNTPYTVVYWQENATNADYSYYESKNRTGTTDTPASYSTETYTGFTLNTSKTQSRKVK